MEVNSPPNQSYWFVVREDQSNVIFSSNNFTIHNPQNIQAQEGRYIVDTSENNQYIQIQDVPQSNCKKEISKTTKDDVNFWDRSKIKTLLTWCLENRYIVNNKDITYWEEIATAVGTTVFECNKKYKNLKKTYLRLLKKKLSGKEIKWVHYNLCEEVFVDCKSMALSILEPWDDSKIRRLLNFYIENVSKFRSARLHKDVWKTIATELKTTEQSCYNKYKNLKRKYWYWVQRSRDTGKKIKWPYHQYFERIYYNHGPNIAMWNTTSIKKLLYAYDQIAYKFRNPAFQKKELWKEISAVVGICPEDCNRKFRNLKQTYIRLKMRSQSGRPITKWLYYNEFELIFEHHNCMIVDDEFKRNNKFGENQDYITQLLKFYLEHQDQFRNPLIKNKTLWRKISPIIGLSSEGCDRKFRNLKQTYLRLLERRIQTGKGSSWPYFSIFEKIYRHPCNLKGVSKPYNIDKISLTKIKEVVKNVCEKVNDNDKFEKLVRVIEDSNNIQRERNIILRALLDKR